MILINNKKFLFLIILMQLGIWVRKKNFHFCLRERGKNKEGKTMKKIDFLRSKGPKKRDGGTMKRAWQ